jgi:cytochrome P450
MQLPLDLHSREFLEDPAPTLDWLRAHDPVHRSPYGYVLLTRYDDVAAALRDPRLSSHWGRKHAGRPPADDPFLRAQQVVFHSFNMQDPPTHTRIRALVQQAFSRAAVDDQRDRVLGLVDELLDVGAARPDRSLDLVAELAFPLTITVASEMIGIPADARAEFRASFESTERLGDPTASAEQRRAGQDALVWQLGFIADVVAARRRDPRADLVSALVQAEQAGETLTEDEILAALLTLYTAAGTTTERMISSGMLLLLQHPEQWARVSADPAAALPGAVSEILRFHHPNQQTTTSRSVACPSPRARRCGWRWVRPTATRHAGTTPAGSTSGGPSWCRSRSARAFTTASARRSRACRRWSRSVASPSASPTCGSLRERCVTTRGGWTATSGCWCSWWPEPFVGAAPPRR